MILMIRDLDAWIRGLVINQKDEVSRGIFADYLEDNGHWREAAGQRWLIENHLYPRGLTFSPVRNIRNMKNSDYAVFLTIRQLYSIGLWYSGKITKEYSEKHHIKCCGHLDWLDGIPSVKVRA